MFDPWLYVERHLPGWRVEWARSPRHRGLTHFRRRLIVLDDSLTQAAVRGVLTHEACHAVRGSFPRWMRAREEAHVSAMAARLLIPIRALGEAMAWSPHIDEVAEELHVDSATVVARLRHLHAAERHYLQRRLEHLNAA